MNNSNSLEERILALLPADGSTMGNMAVLQALEAGGHQTTDDEYQAARDSLLTAGLIVKGRGRGGSIAKVLSSSDALVLEVQTTPEDSPETKKPRQKKATKKASRSKTDQTQVLSYRYDDKRKNNPHVGMVDTHSDGVEEKKVWRYDPHLDPELQFDSSANRSQVEALIDNALQATAAEAEHTKGELLAWLDHALAGHDEAAVREVVTNLRKRVADQKPSSDAQRSLEELKRLQAPYLQWTGKAERTSFEVDTVSLHVHERIDPATILAAVQKRIKDAQSGDSTGLQSDLFSAPFENLPMHQAIDFYKHERDWANRLIAGDSLLVMNSMLEKEGMAGQVQMIYIDPPYGIKYGSNFQPFTNNRSVSDGRDQDLTQEPEMIKAFRDTWELGIHSYLTYLRDRLLLSKDLLRSSGSIFVQISDENLHIVRQLLDEIFGQTNFISQISYSTTTGTADALLSSEHDKILWYARNRSEVKYNQLWLEKSVKDVKSYKYKVASNRRSYSSLSKEEKSGSRKVPDGWAISQLSFAVSQDPGSPEERFYNLFGKEYDCGVSRHWKTKNPTGLDRLHRAGRLLPLASQLNYIRFLDDYPLTVLTNVWDDTGSAGYSNQDPKRYVVQTDTSVVQRCLLMATDPGDIVIDPTCGSGTTALVAERWGRRWITCDTSRVAITLAKQRLMTASFDYFDLKYPHEGLRGGFIYKTVPHVTLKSIANNPEVDQIYGRMHPEVVEELAKLNATLKGHDHQFIVAEGGRKGRSVQFNATDTDTLELPSGEVAKVNALLEWEVPFEFPEDWPDVAKEPFEAFHTARRTMQQQMDASIAAHAGQEVLYDQPTVAKDKLRITGPFTVEAAPFPTVLGLDDTEQPTEADIAVARSGATSLQAQWRDELIKTGIRGKGGQKLKLMDLEPLPGTHYIHAVGTVADSGERVAVSFGPEHAALEQRQVEIAMREASELFPLPKMLLFCAFTFDPEAAKDIDAIKGVQALKAQMNTDLLTEDLKKGRASNESFWLMGQPEVEVHSNKDETLTVEVHGFDYFDTKTGELKSGGKKNIAMWALDTDYDNRSLYPRQVFFPMAGSKDGWYKLKKDIRAELNEDLLESFHGTVSLPFKPGDNKCLAVKIVDDRGIESLKVIRLD
ncbi:site-specific DNA-methyltransferase [Parahaliea mediterranea]|uniref:site-specific DNA-methyltransferase (adenine-specific) n=1 Tax=Parahaliea mediterranea TaxID=651086 RepID=A0A939IKZ6_9GAMM|nr:site-specific DNA-methyltransferase [Parahaliea mediterranea]MBN7795945.1 site-specific DNA-methyltransferase [Parahaliea mediterranea]